MARAHRLFGLLQILRRHRGPVSAAALAREAGVSIRTIYRDIGALQSLGAEIDGEPGFGYVLRPGFLLPPLMFSSGEIEALRLGLQWAARRTDAELSEAARNAMAKIAAVLPAELREKMDDDAVQIVPFHKPSPGVELSLLRRALNEERKLAIAYRDEKGAASQRVIWPVTLGFFESTRILAAWCELREAYRHFRTDRIEAAEVLDARPPRRRRTLAREWRQLMEAERVMLTRSDSAPA